jgi:Cu/Zn superoxide dismutase
MKVSQLAFLLVNSIFENSAKPVQAIAKLKANGFEATVKFTQKSCHTEIELDFHCIPDYPGQTPYPWHVHVKPVDNTGDCKSTGLHLDPANLNPGGNSTTYKCDPKNPKETCELGDLSGKFGKLEPKQKTYKFSDPDLLLIGEDGIIGRSIVIHLANSTRIACANITAV